MTLLGDEFRGSSTHRAADRICRIAYVHAIVHAVTALVHALVDGQARAARDAADQLLNRKDVFGEPVSW